MVSGEIFFVNSVRKHRVVAPYLGPLFGTKSWAAFRHRKQTRYLFRFMNCKLRPREQVFLGAVFRHPVQPRFVITRALFVVFLCGFQGMRRLAMVELSAIRSSA